jgi:pilus assembly protein CpaE
MFAPGLKKHDVVHALGKDFVAAVPNNYRLVREAIDRGVPLEEIKPGNKITQQLKRLIAMPVAKPAAAPAVATPAGTRNLNLSLAR